MTTALATAPHHQAIDVADRMLTRDQLELLKRTIAKGTTDDEFALFVATANRLGLDPFARQIFAVKRWDSQEGKEVMSIQVSIDGFRVGAMRTGEVDGQEGPFWCGEDGAWREVWLAKEPPAAAKVVVYRKGCSRPFVGIASYLSYVQRKKNGDVNSMWSRGPDVVLAKCAEALALRKAFPAELAGAITPEEAGSEAEPEKFAPIAAPAAAVAAPVKGEASAPAKAAAATTVTLTDEELADIEAAMGKCMSLAELKKLSADRVPKNLEEVQRKRLAKAYEDQWYLIDAASREEKGEPS